MHSDAGCARCKKQSYERCGHMPDEDRCGMQSYERCGHMADEDRCGMQSAVGGRAVSTCLAHLLMKK